MSVLARVCCGTHRPCPWAAGRSNAFSREASGRGPRFPVGIGPRFPLGSGPSRERPGRPGVAPGAEAAGRMGRRLRAGWHPGSRRCCGPCRSLLLKVLRALPKAVESELLLAAVVARATGFAAGGATTGAGAGVLGRRWSSRSPQALSGAAGNRRHARFGNGRRNALPAKAPRAAAGLIPAAALAAASLVSFSALVAASTCASSSAAPLNLLAHLLGDGPAGIELECVLLFRDAVPQATGQ